MKSKNKWKGFVVVCIIILLVVILEQAITTTRLTAHISEREQQKAIDLSENFLKDDLNVEQYKVFVGKTGKYLYLDDGTRKKVIEVTFTYGNRSLTTLVDVSSDKIVQVSRTVKYE